MGKIPKQQSSQSWLLLEFVRKALIGCLAVWEFFPHNPVFFSDSVPKPNVAMICDLIDSPGGKRGKYQEELQPAPALHHHKG